MPLKNIRINAVALGTTNNDVIESMTKIPLSAMQLYCVRENRIKSLRLCVWLLSDEASFVTGHVLSVDGRFQAK
ncbi:SDR family oxidoreductase [Paenibacillus sp. VMFN-D1]|uniref:SDR family oxidoreductase n=1 Tax=Paenibacillus sp. VMFN-D1 TaxID=2135608 RepID=UPI000E23F3D3